MMTSNIPANEMHLNTWRRSVNQRATPQHFDTWRNEMANRTPTRAQRETWSNSANRETSQQQPVVEERTTWGLTHIAAVAIAIALLGAMVFLSIQGTSQL